MADAPENSVARVNRKLVVSLTKAGNAEIDRVMKDLTERGFHLEKTLEFGAAKLIVGQKDGDYIGLEAIDGVDQVRAEGTKRTI